MIPRYNQPVFSEADESGGGGGGGGGSLLGGALPAAPAAPVAPAGAAGSEQQQTPAQSLPILGEDGKFSPQWYKGNADLEPYAKQLDKFSDPAGLAKSYANLERTRTVPAEGAEEGAIAAFRTANNIPATFEEYDLKFPEELPDGIAIDEAATKSYKELFHKLNLTPYQAEKLAEGHLAQTAEMFKTMQAKQGESSMEGVTDLQKEWGIKFDANLATAQKTFDALCNKSGVDPESVPFTGDPSFAKLMATVSSMMGESSVIGANGAGVDLKSSKQEAGEIMTNASHPDYKAFYNPNDPRHAEVQDRVARMNR